MIHKIFTIYDAKAKAYLPPFFMHQTGMASRAFINGAADPQSKFHMNPEDFSLHDIGTYDDETALIKPHQITVVITGIQAHASISHDSPILPSAERGDPAEQLQPLTRA